MHLFFDENGPGQTAAGRPYCRDRLRVVLVIYITSGLLQYVVDVFIFMLLHFVIGLSLQHQLVEISILRGDEGQEVEIFDDICSAAGLFGFGNENFTQSLFHEVCEE